MPSMLLERIGSNWSDTGSLLQKKNENGPKELALYFVDPFVAWQKGSLEAKSETADPRSRGALCS